MSHLDPLSSASSSTSSWFVSTMKNAGVATLSFLITKYFPNLQLGEMEREKRVRFKKLPLIENETQEKEADSYLKNGDLAMGRGSYTEASKYYRLATTLYDKLNSQEIPAMPPSDKKPPAAEPPEGEHSLKDSKYEDVNTKYLNALEDAKESQALRLIAKKAMDQFKFTYGMHLYSKAKDLEQNDPESAQFYYEEAFNRIKEFNCLERDISKGMVANRE